MPTAYYTIIIYNIIMSYTYFVFFQTTRFLLYYINIGINIYEKRFLRIIHKKKLCTIIINNIIRVYNILLYVLLLTIVNAKIDKLGRNRFQ